MHRNKYPTDIFNRNRSITFEKYDSKMKKYTKEKILEDLLVYIESLPELAGEESNITKGCVSEI